MKISRSDFNARWSQLHGGAEIQGAVKGWLAISYYIARALTVLRITPNFMTIIGVLLSAAMLRPIFAGDEMIPLLPAIIFLVLSLIADGVDGSVAIYQNRASALGGIYDAIADRISEALWLTFTVYIGVPAECAIAIWILGATQEYARARLASMGHSKVGVLTPTERPMRAIYVLFIILINVFSDIFPDVISTEIANNFVSLLSIAFIALQLISVWMIVKMARSILH
jgi:CDP-diacylglycerol--glycerol-3-phosphate 3-phosphatidyltransferase